MIKKIDVAVIRTSDAVLRFSKSLLYEYLQ